MYEDDYADTWIDEAEADWYDCGGYDEWTKIQPLPLGVKQAALRKLFEKIRRYE